MDAFVRFQITSCEYCDKTIIRNSLEEHLFVCKKKQEQEDLAQQFRSEVVGLREDSCQANQQAFFTTRGRQGMAENEILEESPLNSDKDYYKEVYKNILGS